MPGARRRRRSTVVLVVALAGVLAATTAISGATPGRGRSGDAGLAAAEWIVVDREQDIATDDDHPAVFGHRFDGPMAGHFTGMPVHYDLHAWAWMENPDGGFTADNPTVNCP